MDPVTHTLLGAAIGESFFRRRYGAKAVVVSMWAANLPDIDALVLLTGDPGAVLLRRSFGHSLLLLPLWIAGLTWIFKKKYSDFEASALAWIIALNCLGHLGFDLINSFGVQLFWPLSLMRPELSIIFIIDLTLAGLLIVPHLARFKEDRETALVLACRASLVAVVFYLTMAFVARELAMSQLTQETGGASFHYAFPEPFGAHRWRGVAKEDGAWKLSLIDASRGTMTPPMSERDDEDSEPARAAAQTPFGRRLLTFFKAPVWTVERTVEGGATVSVRDLRFDSMILASPNPFKYEFDVSPSGEAKPRKVKIW